MTVRTTQTKIHLFRRFFSGLPHVYGTYDTSSQRVRQVKAPVTDAVILAHLQGRQSYGVYLLVQDQTRAIAADFDDNDLWAPMEFVKAAEVYGISAYIERSKSKGHHVWIFFGDEPVSARKARLVVRRILAEIEKPQTEVFPKQDAITDAVTYGNFINAPLFGALVPAERTVFLDPADPSRPFVDQWALLESAEVVREQLLDEIIELNDLETSVNGSGGCYTGAGNAFCLGLPPCAQTMLSDGVTTNQRVACFRLAVNLKRAGLPFDSTIAVLVDWAGRNRPSEGKRIITEAEISSQAACAYDKDYRARGCEEPALQPFCTASCPVRRPDHVDTNLESVK